MNSNAYDCHVRFNGFRKKHPNSHGPWSPSHQVDLSLTILSSLFDDLYIKILRRMFCHLLSFWMVLTLIMICAQDCSWSSLIISSSWSSLFFTVIFAITFSGGCQGLACLS